MSIATEIQRIESAKADIKNAIINKGVEVGDGLIDTYAEKIGKIPSGDEKYQEGYEQGYTQGYEKGSMPIYYCAWTAESIWRDVVFPENTDLFLRFKKAPDSFNGTFYNSKNLKTIKLISEDKSNIWKASSTFRNSAQLEICDLTDFNPKPSDVSWCFLGDTNLKSILGDLDFSECKSCAIWLNSCGKLEDISFVPNTIKISILFDYCSNLTNKSKQSIFDGLAQVETAQTLTLHSNLKILQPSNL